MSRHVIGLFIHNPVDRRLLSDFLREAGHEVYAPPHSDPRPEYKQGTGLIIADQHAARKYQDKLLNLRWRSGAVFLPLLIILPQKEDSVLWLRAGFDDVLRQPITKAELLARLEVFFRFRDQSEQYQLMFENALVGMYRSTPDGRLVMANPALARMLGYSSFDELARLNLDREVRAQGSRELFREQIESSGRVVGLESVWTGKDGRELSVLENARAVRDEAGRVLYTEGSAEDITERKRAEEERERLLSSERQARQQAEESNRLKDEFLATVSHELRTPLTAILGWAHMLRSGQLKDQDTTGRALEVIQRNARAQLQLIEDLLDVSRIITGKLRLDVRPVAPATFIESAVESVRPAAEAKGVRLQKVFDASLSLVHGDATRLQQVVWNLLSNAIKFTPRGGRVEVRSERVASHVEITVSDTGEGIAPEFLPFVFDRFRQADGTTMREHGGLGLGLAIVRHLVELHGGTVEAESGGAGRGATFRVKLPLLAVRQVESSEGDARQPSINAQPSVECTDRLGGLRVLVVDDEEDARELVRLILESCGAEVATAGSGGEGFDVFEKFRPDVLISDIGMPGEDGYVLIEKVRALPPERGGLVPAVALTAYARAEDRLRVLRAGYQIHVSKPVEPVELIAIVDKLAALTDKAKQQS